MSPQEIVQEPMGPEPEGGRPPISANALQLSPREMLAAAAGLVLLLLVFPAFRTKIKSPDLPRDYRIPYALTDHYDLYERYSVLAAPKFDTLLVGDSVVWGQCADWDGTLSHHLNAQAGGERFANLGLDGMHPVALSMLMQHHAPGIAGRQVVLQCNLLWYISTGIRRTREDLLKNRPNLGPRFGPTVTVYQERFLHLLGMAVSESPALQSALRGAGGLLPERLDILPWILENPYGNPFKNLSFSLPLPETKAPQNPVPYPRGREALQERWDPLEKSLMWLAFRETVAVLEERGNRVTILLGPMNEDALSRESREACSVLKNRIRQWCDAKGIPCVVPDVLPVDLFADICHPTDAGYAELARRLRNDYPALFAPGPK